MVWKGEGEKNIPCLQIVQQYNKRMIGVGLADMLLSLHQIPWKTKRWYQKIFWHLTDMTKINVWTLYRRHICQNGKSHNNNKSLLQFSLELLDALILANKVNPSGSRRRFPKRRSLEAPTTGKIPLKHCLSPMFVLIKSHIGQALLPTKIDADYAIWPAECNVPNPRSFSVYWLITIG